MTVYYIERISYFYGNSVDKKIRFRDSLDVVI